MLTLKFEIFVTANIYIFFVIFFNFRYDYFKNMFSRRGRDGRTGGGSISKRPCINFSQRYLSLPI